MRTVTMRYGQAGERSNNSPTETLLWSRASETGAFTSTLSSPASAFDYLRIVVLPFSDGPTYSVIVDCSDLSEMVSSVTGTGRITLGGRGTSYRYARFGEFNADYTQISWTTSYRAGATNTNASYALPTQIYGVKL